MSEQQQQQKELIDVGKKHLEQLLQMNMFHLNPGDSKSSLEQLSQQMNSYQQYPSTIMAAAQLQLHHDNTNNNVGKQDRDKSSPQGPKRPFLEASHPLYSRGICRWTGCEAGFSSFEQFKEHLNKDHVLDERSTAQTRVQVQIVSQLEQQLARERHRLEAMMSHLHPNGSKRIANDQMSQAKLNDYAQKPATSNHETKHEEKSYGGGSSMISLGQLEGSLLQGLATNPNFNLQSFMNNSPAFAGLVRSKMGPSSNINCGPNKYTEETMDYRNFKQDERFQRPNPSDISGEARRSPVRGMTRSGSSGQLDIESEITRNRDFYRSQDVRPPFTYAALIRQGIIESPDKQLTLNEIYTWFQNTFAYFRRNAATWKNAVRHSLSLHKCFMRVENVKGAVWTVDETEYHRRRPQRGSVGPAKSNGLSRSESPIAAADQDSYTNFHQGFGPSMVHPFNGFSPEQQAYLQGLGMGSFPRAGQCPEIESKGASDFEEDLLEKKKGDSEVGSDSIVEPEDSPACHQGLQVKGVKSESTSDNDHEEGNDENDNSDSPEDLSKNTRLYQRQARKRFHPYQQQTLSESLKDTIKPEPPSLEN